MEINREYVDLGLPSGLLWAKCNIGANKPEEAGLYFQWGDVQGYTAEQVGSGEGLKEFSSALTDYKFAAFAEDQLTGITKYNEYDGKTVMDLEDDAAHVLMGGNWRLPTQGDFVELVNNTNIFLVPTSGEEISDAVKTYGDYPVYFEFPTTAETCTGMKFYKKDDHSIYLFVPAVGGAYRGSIHGGAYGNFWSSSLDPSVVGAWCFEFSAHGRYGGVVDQYRCVGMPLRGVRPK